MPGQVLQSVLSYTANLGLQYQAIKTAMDRVISAELVAVLPVLRWVLAFYVLVHFWRFATANAHWSSLMWALVRALVVVFFLKGSGAYTANVRDMLFETIPNGVVASTTGSSVLISAPQQFDIVSTAIDALTADIRRQNTSWSVSAIGNSLATWLVNVGLQAAVAVQAYVWLVSVRALAITLCLGVWFIMFELFERTRGFFQHWIGTAVGIVTFQVVSAIYLSLSMQSEMEMLRAIQANSRSFDIDQMISNLIHVGASMFGDALTMLVLPTICALAAGGGVHIGATRAASAIPGAAAAAVSKLRG